MNNLKKKRSGQRNEMFIFHQPTLNTKWFPNFLFYQQSPRKSLKNLHTLVKSIFFSVWSIRQAKPIPKGKMFFHMYSKTTSLAIILVEERYGKKRVKPWGNYDIFFFINPNMFRKNQLHYKKKSLESYCRSVPNLP